MYRYILFVICKLNVVRAVDTGSRDVMFQCRHLSAMLSNVLELRSSNWGRNVADTPVMAVSVRLMH